jgi:iron complex outermembrane receptor protein
MNLLLALLLCFQDPAPAKPKTDDDKKPEKEVVVTAPRRETDPQEVPAGVTVVTAAQIQESGATNMVEVVKAQTGIFSQGQVKGAYDQIVDLRGYNNGAGNGQRTLVMVDGRKTNGVTTSATDWATIPLNNIERIEIIRGPAASIYGDTALAGVINIITKKGTKDPFATLELSGGTWSTFSAAATAGASSGPAAVDLQVQNDRTQGYRQHSGYRGTTATARTDFEVSPDIRVYAKLGYHNDERERPGSLTLAEIDTVGRRGSVRPGNAESEEFYADAGYEERLGAYGEVSVFLDYTRRNGNSFDEEFQFSTQDASNVTMLQLKHILTPQIAGVDTAFTTGIDLSYETAIGDTDSPNFFPPPPIFSTTASYLRRLMGLYEQIEARPVKGLLITGGVRYDRALFDLVRADNSPSKFEDQRALDQWCPQGGVSYRVIEELTVYASAGRTFKYPTRDELIGFSSSDPLLKPEHATTYQGGFRVHSANVASGEVTLYRMIVHDEIYFDPDFTPFFGSNFNFGKVTHSGVETQGRVSPVEWLDLFGTYTFTKVTIDQAPDPAQDGKTYPVTPRHTATAGITARYGGATATLSTRFVGQRLLIGDFLNVGPKLPDYVAYDAKVAYTWKNLTGFISVFNFTNRLYFDSGGITGRFNPAPELSVLGGAEVRF